MSINLIVGKQPNGVRYWACGWDADSLDGQIKLRDADNAPKAAPYPQVQCTTKERGSFFTQERLLVRQDV